MSAAVQILTIPDCSSCAAVESMLDRMGVEYEVIDITKQPEILQKYPVMTAPGVVINNKLEFMGIPKEKDLAEKVKGI